MSFQSNVQILQGFEVPGEIFQDVPWTVLSYTLNSSGTPNVVGSTAYTITGDGVDGYPYAQAGNGGQHGFAGILCAPKSYTLMGVEGSALEPSLVLQDQTQAELLTVGMMAVILPVTANIGDYVIYDNSTGTLTSIPPSETIPSGFSSANAVVSQFNKTLHGNAIAVIYVNAAGSSIDGLSNFEYVNTLWSASNGLDTNSGSSINLPMLTPAVIRDALIPSVPNVWNIVDAGSYSFDVAFEPLCPLVINAPGASFVWGGVPDYGFGMFNQNTSLARPLFLNAGLIDGTNIPNIFQGASWIFVTGPGGYLNTVNTTSIWIDSSGERPIEYAVFNINTDVDGGSFAFRDGGMQVINAINLGQSAISSSTTSGSLNEITEIKAHFFDGSIGGTADYFMNIAYLGADFENGTAGILNLFAGKSDLDVSTISFNGIVCDNPSSASYPGNVVTNPLYLVQQPIIGEVYSIVFEAPASPTVWSFNPAIQKGNTQISIPQNAANGTITIPAGSTVPYGWRMTFQQTVASGALVQITPSSNDTLNGQGIGPGATSCYTGIGIGEFVRGFANGSGGYDWAVSNCFTTN